MNSIKAHVVNRYLFINKTTCIESTTLFCLQTNSPETVPAAPFSIILISNNAGAKAGEKRMEKIGEFEKHKNHP